MGHENPRIRHGTQRACLTLVLLMTGVSTEVRPDRASMRLKTQKLQRALSPAVSRDFDGTMPGC